MSTNENPLHTDENFQQLRDEYRRLVKLRQRNRNNKQTLNRIAREIRLLQTRAKLAGFDPIYLTF